MPEQGQYKLKLIYMTTIDFYKKNFVCDEITINRYKLETLIEPFCTRGLSDEQMQNLADEIHEESRRKIVSIDEPHLFARKKALNEVIDLTIYEVMRNQKVPEYLKCPEIDRYDICMLKIMNPVYDKYYGLNKEDMKKVNNWVREIESFLDVKPKEGDIVNFTSKYGDYHERTLLETHLKSDGLFKLCLLPQIPFAVKSDGKYQISSSGADFRTIDPELLVKKDTTYALFQDWGHRGPCSNGSIEFVAQVNLWEYKHPYPRYGDFSTNEYQKILLKKDNKGGYFGKDISFSTKKLLNEFMERFHGILFSGDSENQFILWCYKKQFLELAPIDWEMMKLTEYYAVIKNSHQKVKFEKDHDKHCVNFYYVETNK